MNTFEYTTASSPEQAVSLLGKSWEDARLLAGGVDLLGEMKERIVTPKRVVNIKGIPGLNTIQEKGGELRIGAIATLRAIERHPAILKRWTAIAEASASVGAPQIRNVGTLGGNLCQRPRCWYYRSDLFHCLKKGGDRCYAEDGENAYHAIFGNGPCHIVHPSDVAPAIIALGGRIAVVGPKGRREVPAEEFYIMPDVDPSAETILKPNEIVVEVIIPSLPEGTKSLYLKQREKQSLDFALAGVAVVITVENGICRQARIVLSGVAPVPWRAREAEVVLIGKKIRNKSPGPVETGPLVYPDDALLVGKRVDLELVKAAADAALATAKPMRDNGYKVPLAKTLIKRAIVRAI